MKKFSKIIENQGNVFQKGTPFSNGHRSRTKKNGFLMGHHLMIDIDGLVVDSSDNIVAIIENKKQIPGEKSEFKNILDPNIRTPQKLALLELCRLLNCKLYVNIEKDKTYHLLKPDFSTIPYTDEVINKTMKEKGLNMINSDNIIFLEFRLDPKATFRAVFERTGSNTILYPYISQILKVCGSAQHVQVDDQYDAKSERFIVPISQAKITFRIKGQIQGVVQSVLFPQYVDEITRGNLQNKWEEIWRNLSLWD